MLASSSRCFADGKTGNVGYVLVWFKLLVLADSVGCGFLLCLGVFNDSVLLGHFWCSLGGCCGGASKIGSGVLSRWNERGEGRGKSNEGECKRRKGRNGSTWGKLTKE